MAGYTNQSAHQAAVSAKCWHARHRSSKTSHRSVLFSGDGRLSGWSSSSLCSPYPSYLASHLCCVAEIVTATSSTSAVDVPSKRRDIVGDRVFGVAAARVWNTVRHIEVTARLQATTEDIINPIKPNSSNSYTLPYRPNLPFLISGIRAT